MGIGKVVEPKTLEEVKEYLTSYEKCSKILAGGTDLVIEINKDEIEVEVLLSLNKIEELKRIEEKEDSISLGSMVTFTDMQKSNYIREYFGTLVDCSDSMGSPQIRNMATIGGNIANAASAADIIPSLMVLNAEITIESKEKSRTLSVVEYFKNFKEEKITQKELITKIIIPKQNTVSSFYKLGKRNSLAISRINVALGIEMEASTEGKEKIKGFTVALGAVGRHPFRVVELEKQLQGKELNDIDREEVLQFIENVVAESIKGRPTMPFKKEAIKGVYREAVRRVFKRRGEEIE